VGTPCCAPKNLKNETKILCATDYNHRVDHLQRLRHQGREDESGAVAQLDRLADEDGLEVLRVARSLGHADLQKRGPLCRDCPGDAVKYLMVSALPAQWVMNPSGDRCYDFLNIFAEKFSEKIGSFDSNQS
jgi:hypothetical protein